MTIPVPEEAVEEAQEDVQYAVAIGNPFDGMTLYGPFDSEAVEVFTLGIRTSEEWWILELHSHEQDHKKKGD